MKVKDLISEDIDIDVYDDYDERCGMAVCGPVKLTAAGESIFSVVLDMSCWIDGNKAIVHCDNEYAAEALLNFCLAAAGYISDALYRKWFIEK